MKRLTKDQFINTLDPTTEPRLRVESGEEIVVETWDAFMGAWEAGAERDILGPVAGPIAVRGASPGDALRVDLLEITPKDLTPGRSAMRYA